MDNFFETYKGDIMAFFEALKALVEAIIAKFSASSEE